jgi:hypothetical protein
VDVDVADRASVCSDWTVCVGVGLNGTIHTTVCYWSRWTVMHCQLLISLCKFKFDEKKFDHLNINLIIFHHLGPKFLKKLKKLNSIPYLPINIV